MAQESYFVDYVKIYCRSGKGGRGSAHMHRAKYMPKGGPDGGNGGRGGHVILRGNRNYWTLFSSVVAVSWRQGHICIVWGNVGHKSDFIYNMWN